LKELEGNWNGAAGPNKYQYNSKEWNDDFGLSWNDYGAWFYDPAVGRWWSVDPLAGKTKSWTPYRYGFNNPINFIDPDGRSETGWIERKDGTVYYDKDVHSKKDLKENIKKDESKKGESYLGEDVVLKDKNTGNSYLGMADGSLTATTDNGEAAIVRPAIRDHDPAYSPYNPAAIGIELKGSISYGVVSYSLSFGFAVGAGEIGVFMSPSVGVGTGSGIGGSAGVSLFWSDKTDDGVDANGNPIVPMELAQLGGGALGLSGNIGPINAGVSQGTTTPNSIKPSKETYRTKSIGVGIPGTKGLGFRAEKSNTYLKSLKL
jgi:RHS repeat-associated protein